jgi:hypothetical protein
MSAITTTEQAAVATTVAGVVAVPLRDLPTAPLHQARLQLFEATRRPRHRRREIVTPWGTGTITGCLGQGHADVLEAVLYTALRSRWLRDAQTLEMLADPYRVRLAAGGGRQLSYEQLHDVLDELRSATIDIRLAAGGWYIGGLVDDVVYSKTHLATDPLHRDQRSLLVVRLGRAYAAWLREDLQMHYDPTPIAALRTGVAQAIARHVRTHRGEPSGGWRLDTLIEAVAGEMPAATLRDRRRELRTDAAGLAACGVVLDGDRVHRTPAGGVGQTPGSVGQTPGSVGQTPGGVGQTPGAISIF